MERFFLGGNTGSGFAGYYTGERERADRVFLIKGGPGTGKSSLMKKIGKKHMNIAESDDSFSQLYHFPFYTIP